MAAAFQAFEKSLETVMSFKYLQLLITTRVDVWKEVIVNLKKVWRIW